jgi:LruC domain-containing protein
MNTRKYINLVVLAFSIIITACINVIDTSEVALTANEKFTFATTKAIKLDVSVNDTYNNLYYYKVEVFDRNPFSTDTVANLLTAGVAKGSTSLNVSLAIPQHITKIYIRQTDPLKRKTVKVIDVNAEADNYACNFKPILSSQSVSNSSKVLSATDPKATDYSLPTTYITLTNAAVTLSGEKYYLPTGVNASEINFGWKSNSELYVAGNVTFTQIYIPSNCKLIILPGGKVTFNVDANFEQSNIIAVHPEANLIFNKKSSLGKGTLLLNDGTTNMNADFEIRGEGSLINNGTLNGTKLTQTNNSIAINNSSMYLATELIMNSNTSFRNDGVFEASSKIITNNITAIITNNHILKTLSLDMLNGGGVLNNNCKVECTDMLLQGVTVNSSAGTLISCKNLYVHSSTITLNGNAIIKTGVSQGAAVGQLTEGVTFDYAVIITGNSNSSGSPLFSILKLNNKTTGWKVVELKGTLEYVLPAVETPNSNFYNKIESGISIVENSTINIAATECNGLGQAEDNGSGNPASPELPMLVEEGNEYTFAMEDLWPNLGDNDMNDFVFNIKNIKKTINTSNEVTNMSFDIQPLAAGSTKELSAALQFDNITSGKISVSSTGSIASIEEGQVLANIVLFPNVHSLFGMSSPGVVNTFSHVSKIEANKYTFNITFTNPVSADDVIITNMNFYINVGNVSGNDRKEVHLAGFKPSTKVQKQTNNYKDSNNMVWAIMLPVGDFKYPTESTKISDAYSKLKTWAASAGTVDLDWYLYPNKELVYLK